MTTSEDYRLMSSQPSSIVDRARKVLKNYNFIRSTKLARLLQIKGQQASRILQAMPEWYKYSDGNGRTWARVGHPI